MIEVKTFLCTASELERGMLVAHSVFADSRRDSLSLGVCSFKNIKYVEAVGEVIRVECIDAPRPTYFDKNDKVLIIKTVDGLNP